MKTELDPKLAWGAIALLIAAVALGYYFFFRTPSGELTPEQAGAGKPMRPGELPPGTPPPPWASTPPNTTQTQ
jgi:hypothetical protein